MSASGSIAGIGSPAIKAFNNIGRPPSQDEIDKLKESLHYLIVRDYNAHKLAEQLLKITPQNIELDELVDLIFKCSCRWEIEPLLKAILAANPSFALSAYDKIREAIVKDTEFTLNNDALMALLKEHNLEGNSEKIQECYDLAHRLNHPYLYPLAENAILPSEYTINFLWVNLNPQDRLHDLAQNIFGEGLNLSENAECLKDPTALRTMENSTHSPEDGSSESWKKIRKTITYRISKWADANPNTTINLWFDSALVTQRAYQNTYAMLRSISTSRRVNLKLRDIRHLPNIEEEIKNTLHPATQVYFRVDMLKAVISDYMISDLAVAKYCVITDIDVEPMSSEQIFDQRTLHYLNTYGYVFNTWGDISNFENSFFIFNKEAKGLKDLHYGSIIKATVSTIETFRKLPIGARIHTKNVLDAQYVFEQYSTFRIRMGEMLPDEFGAALKNPRKVVRNPKSQFDSGGYFPTSSFRAESFRFIGSSNVPYTRNGRSGYSGKETQIESLIDWEAIPLSQEDSY